ncbi:cysteine hydrolase family protein [Streptococcus catagoni]|uniref:cysteine hydrolase family protein n=1 Tax=Streptococcus catagoni TaxID=2654874 RepID=UPI00140AE57D|nr:cysteine hydrolase family protein [Streptococcus catagoni]
MKTGLLLVDMQNQLLESNPHHLSQMMTGVQQLVDDFRQSGQPIIFVRHHDQDMPINSRDWEITPQLEPLTGEKIIDKAYNSAFKNTDLQDYLKSQEIGQLIIVGMQVEYCIDATIKSAFDLDYQVIVPKGLSSTFDNPLLSAQTLITHYEAIWQGRFAQLLSLKEILKKKEYGN